MSDDPEYTTHARRIDLYRRLAVDRPAVTAYLSGYRAGMVATRGQTTNPDETASRQQLAQDAIAGVVEDADRVAWGCGYHDGEQWEAPREQRGLIRLAAQELAEGSVRHLAREIVDVDEGSVRQMLRGTRDVSPALRETLRDRLLMGD